MTSGTTPAVGGSSAAPSTAKTELEELEAKCGAFYEKVFKGLGALEAAQQWWPATALCAIAIDVIATGTSVSGKHSGKTYRKFLRSCPALAPYCPFAARFYSSVRSGLIHTMLPNSGPKGKQGPAAVDEHQQPPRVVALATDPTKDYLIVGAPHLLMCTRQMLEDFRKGPVTAAHRRFIARFTMTVYDETPAGLVVKVVV